MTASLFDSIRFGSIDCKNCIIMAPLTRGRAEGNGIPTDLMVEYYSQRAGAGMIISEATAISPQGYGWYHAPGIWTDEHVAGWRKITDAVHDAGSNMILQLWHMGRVSHSDFHDGALPVAPSALAAQGDIRVPDGSKKPLETPRALGTSEIPGLIEDYIAAARRAMEAGFDGVEVHSANGYLLDEFLRDGANERTDEYGGSLENRARLLLQVVQAVTKAIGADKVGVRISPTNPKNDMNDSDPAALFSYVAAQLDQFGLAYLHVMEPLPGHMLADPQGRWVLPHIRENFSGPLIANGGYDRDKGNAALANGEADAIAYGVPYIANPDLAERFKAGASLNAPDIETFYTEGPKGYTDYPFLKDRAA
ncbi:MAG: alkene reductase [Rhodospirillales bacterium]|nr:alkene reductase [Rhodospirillales bacterium]